MAAKTIPRVYKSGVFGLPVEKSFNDASVKEDEDVLSENLLLQLHPTHQPTNQTHTLYFAGLL